MRFIPAWAGNTPHRLMRSAASSVHPRVGGEHMPLSAACVSSTGSSPRGRGTRPLRLLQHFRHRFIPAWAGNTPAPPAAALSPPVHPRVGGEHDINAAATGPGGGSSPRGRGTRDGCGDLDQVLRFIPAWAGNTLPRRMKDVQKPVHPRVGGEHHSVLSCSSTCFGSSPRGRGTHLLSSYKRRIGRFIPAWAGNTRRHRGGRGRRAVHPRVGGEHQHAPRLQGDDPGSSPRGRGTQPLDVC